MNDTHKFTNQDVAIDCVEHVQFLRDVVLLSLLTRSENIEGHKTLTLEHMHFKSSLY